VLRSFKYSFEIVLYVLEIDIFDGVGEIGLVGEFERPDVVVKGEGVNYLQPDFGYVCSVCYRSLSPSIAFVVGGEVYCSECLEKLDSVLSGVEVELGEDMPEEQKLDMHLVCVHCLRPVTDREINYETGLCIRCEFPEKVKVPGYARKVC